MLHKQFSSRAVFKFVFAIGGFFNIIFIFLVGLLTILPSLGAFSVIPNNTLPVKCNHQLALEVPDITFTSTDFGS